MAESPEAEARRLRFGDRVRRRRMAMGIMQVELARRAGLPQTQVSKVEKGQYQAMNLTALVQLAQALKTSTDFLLGLSDDPGEVPEKILCEVVA
jgi:transcriptional regulator with XRE-family HTH domain